VPREPTPKSSCSSASSGIEEVVERSDEVDEPFRLGAILILSAGKKYRRGWMADHDHSYKLLFSHASLVADLLLGYVKEDWVQELDFDSLERVDGSYVNDDLRYRESDMVWRVRWKDRFLYIYLLLEFQSTVDPFMPVRCMTYTGLLLQTLINQKALTPNGLLPPVILLVLYNGVRPWTTPQEIAELFEPVPPGLQAYLPRFRHFLLDESRLPEMAEPERNLATALFRLERSRDVDELRWQVVRIVGDEQIEEGFRRSVYTWLARVVLPARFPGLQLPEVRDVKEMNSVLEENMAEWTQRWKEEARQDLLLSLMEARFGLLPEEIRRRVEQIRDEEELKALGKRLLSASSLSDLRLH
jgi:Putative transposase, YhgA-like